jgi:hypothetical protein
VHVVSPAPGDQRCPAPFQITSSFAQARRLTEMRLNRMSTHRSSPACTSRIGLSENCSGSTGALVEDMEATGASCDMIGEHTAGTRSEKYDRWIAASSFALHQILN